MKSQKQNIFHVTPLTDNIIPQYNLTYPQYQNQDPPQRLLNIIYLFFFLFYTNSSSQIQIYNNKHYMAAFSTFRLS